MYAQPGPAEGHRSGRELQMLIPRYKEGSPLRVGGYIYRIVLVLVI